MNPNYHFHIYRRIYIYIYIYIYIVRRHHVNNYHKVFRAMI